MSDAFLPGVPPDLVRAAYIEAPGNELGSGKFISPESSAALVANAFGWFLGPRQACLPIARRQTAAHPLVIATSSESGQGVAELRAEIAALVAR